MVPPCWTVGAGSTESVALGVTLKPTGSTSPAYLWFPLHVAAGEFGEPDTVSDDSEREWVELDTSHPLRPGMFVARVDGRSMEPRIPDGSYCLFAAPVTGSRQGRTVLARMLNALDPDTGQRFTVKRYQSEKTTNEDGWRHLTIVLEPSIPSMNPSS